jgi:phosphatidylserine/phosphatidylglycerophosphate/cardiolipin synthase-like enzyme
LRIRAVLADEAARGIDVQTHIYDDETGIVLMDRLRAAAERGVKVRLLIDDNGLRTDECMPLLLDSPRRSCSRRCPGRRRARRCSPPNFVPGRKGAGDLIRMRRRGVRVRILTNSLASNMERDLAPDRSWRVIMRRGSRELRWLGEKKGTPIEVRDEPDASPWWRAWFRLARQFPYIERFL